MRTSSDVYPVVAIRIVSQEGKFVAEDHPALGFVSMIDCIHSLSCPELLINVPAGAASRQSQLDARPARGGGDPGTVGRDADLQMQSNVHLNVTASPTPGPSSQPPPRPPKSPMLSKRAPPTTMPTTMTFNAERGWTNKLPPHFSSYVPPTLCRAGRVRLGLHVRRRSQAGFG